MVFPSLIEVDSTSISHSIVQWYSWHVLVHQLKRRNKNVVLGPSSMHCKTCDEDGLFEASRTVHATLWKNYAEVYCRTEPIKVIAWICLGIITACKKRRLSSIITWLIQNMTFFVDREKRLQPNSFGIATSLKIVCEFIQHKNIQIPFKVFQNPCQMCKFDYSWHIHSPLSSLVVLIKELCHS